MKKLKVKTQSLPGRCEVCHQTDLFDASTNFCSRCNSVVEPSLYKTENQIYKIQTTDYGVWRRHTYPTGKVYEEFTSHQHYFGYPLVHITKGICPETGRHKTAKGIIAIGKFATGAVAIGQFAAGFIALGQIACGLLAIGQVCLGLFVLAQVAIALLVGIGQVATGIIAIGQVALGYFTLSQI